LNQDGRPRRPIPSTAELLNEYRKAVHDAVPNVTLGKDQHSGLRTGRIHGNNLDVATMLEKYFHDIARNVGLRLRLDQPLGSLDSFLAFIFESLPDYLSDAARRKEDPLPFSLGKIGLTTEYLLAGPLDFGTSNKLRSNELSTTHAIYESLSELSCRLLGISAAKAVLASGKLVQRFITNSEEILKLSGPLQIQLGSQRIRFRVQVLDGLIQGIVIDTPDIEDIAYGYMWREKKSMSGVLKFAILTLGLRNLHYRFYEMTTVNDRVFEVIKKAKDGCDVGLDSLDDAVRDWLGRRGFETREEIEELIEVSRGNLGEVLHILYSVLSVIITRIPRYQDSADWKEPVISWNNIGRYSKEQSEAVANLYYGR